MVDEDNKSIRDIPFPIDDINYEMDKTEEIFDASSEIYPSKEIEEYPEYSSFSKKGNKKAKTIGKLTGVGISSIGVLTFFVAIIFSMMMNNSFSATVSNPKVFVLNNDNNYPPNSISYSFLYTNPYGIGMYCALKDSNSNFISKTQVTGIGSFSGVFSDLEYNSDYTFIVYSQSYGSIINYYESDVLHINSFRDMDFRLSYKLIKEDESYILSYELKYPLEDRLNWKDFILIVEPINDIDHPLSFRDNEDKKIILDSNINSFNLSVSCYDSNLNDRRILAKYLVNIGEE